MLRPSLLLLLFSNPLGAQRSDECVLWAQQGECTKNPEYMLANCLQACNDHPLDDKGEPEQCAGWAAQGECTRNPKYMMHECPKSCSEQRSKMHDGALDERADCLDVAKTAAQCASPTVRKSCEGTCAIRELCADEADPPECERALRCRELKDDWADCASRVTASGCEDAAAGATLLKHCYFSCARVGRASLLRRFRNKYTVRTRRHGLLDEVRRAALATRPARAHPDGACVAHRSRRTAVDRGDRRVQRRGRCRAGRARSLTRSPLRRVRTPQQRCSSDGGARRTHDAPRSERRRHVRRGRATLRCPAS